MSGPSTVAPSRLEGGTVSVIVPCRNERDHIEAFCASVAAQQVPEGWTLEVLIADGQSDDGTRERLAAFCQRDPRFVMIDNPGRIVSCGLNRCIDRAQGRFIVRLDVHTVYAGDYIARCLDTWHATGADNVGGPWRAEGAAGPEGRVQRAIAAAFQSRWVAGGARSRDLGYEGPVDTVYLGACRATPSSASAASTKPWCATRTTSTTCASTKGAGGCGSRPPFALPTTRVRMCPMCSASTASTATGSPS